MKKTYVSPEIIRIHQLPQETGLSRSTCWRLEKDPSSGFPKRIKLTPNGTAVGYLKSELKKWRESRPLVISEKGNSHEEKTKTAPSSKTLEGGQHGN